jgi:hypothetical protein
MITILSGCSKKPDGKVSTYTMTDDKVAISVKKDTITKKGLTLVMENKTGERFNYGAEYHLEKKYNKKWYIIEPKNKIIFTSMAYEVEAEQTKEIKFDWEYGYGELPKGKYRIVKYMYKLKDAPIDESKKTFVAAEFTIK